MRSTTMVRWLAAAFAGVMTVQAARAPHILGRYIVQFQDDYDPSAALDDITTKHEVEVRQRLHFKLFNGADVQFANHHTAGSAAAQIRAMHGVKRVWQSRAYTLPKMTPSWTSNGDVDDDETVKRDVQHDPFSPHIMTQVNLLRDAGIVGKGFKLALIDSGIDYLHPALGGGFGPGHLVSFGKDLVGDDYNLTNTPKPDPDPMDTCVGHGTHVAGIVAAQPDKNPYGIIGAATGVNLGMYRVTTCDGASDDGVLIAAYNSAFEDGADLIHSSIGSEGGWPEEIWSAAVSSIVEHGVPCTLSAGNSGQNGLFSAANAADAIGAAAVGSVDNVVSPSFQVKATYSVNAAPPVEFGFSPGLEKTWTKQTLPLWTPVTNLSAFADESGGCDPYPDTTPNLGGYVVIVPRGVCPYKQKVANAAQWGAKHILISNFYKAGTSSRYNLTGTGISIGLVPQDLGTEWAKLLLSGAKVDVNMVDVAKAPVVLANINNTQSGGYMSTYTSWGPTWQLAVKPQFSSPGGNILSLLPRAMGGYGVESGTSMAGPLVAAIHVLLMEATGIKKDPAKLVRLLSATSKPLDYNDGLKTTVGLPAPVAQQGSGMVQVFEASRARTMFDVDSLAFNDTEHFVAEKNFTIINFGNDTLEYSLEHMPAATAYTFDDDKALFPPETGEDAPEPNVLPNEVVKGHATLEFSPKTLSIPGGKTQVVSVRVTKPAGLDDGRAPVWSGFIRLTGNDGFKLSLPYQGITGSLRDRHVLDVNNTGLTGTRDGELLLGPRTFLLPPPGKANLTRWVYNNDTDMPTVVTSLALGSALVRADLIPVDVPGANFNLTTILDTKTAGPLAGWPFTYAPRGEDVQSSWDGQLDNGTYVPEGVYKISIKALHIFGDRDNRKDYDEVETFKFGIRYAKDI